MNKLMCSICVVAVAVLIVAASSRQSVAQGFNLNDLKKQIDNAKNQNNQSNQNDDNGDNNNSSGQSNQSRKRSKSNNQSNDQDDNQVQQFFPNGQNNQNGQSSRIKFQNSNSNQQGNFQNNQQFKTGSRATRTALKIGTWNGGKWQGSNKVESWTKNIQRQQLAAFQQPVVQRPSQGLERQQ